MLPYFLIKLVVTINPTLATKIYTRFFCLTMKIDLSSGILPLLYISFIILVTLLIPLLKSHLVLLLCFCHLGQCQSYLRFQYFKLFHTLFYIVGLSPLLLWESSPMYFLHFMHAVEGHIFCPAIFFILCSIVFLLLHTSHWAIHL